MLTAESSYFSLGNDGHEPWIYIRDSSEHYSSYLDILFGVDGRPTWWLEAIFISSSLVRLCFDDVWPWPLRRVLLCDSLGPRRSRACVPVVGLASASQAIQLRRDVALSCSWRRFQQAGLVELSLNSTSRSRLIPLARAGLETCLFWPPTMRRSGVCDHETQNLAINAGQRLILGHQFVQRLQKGQGGLCGRASQSFAWPQGQGPILTSDVHEVQQPKLDRPNMLGQHLGGRRQQHLVRDTILCPENFIPLRPLEVPAAIPNRALTIASKLSHLQTPMRRKRI